MTVQLSVKIGILGKIPHKGQKRLTTGFLDF